MSFKTRFTPAIGATAGATCKAARRLEVKKVIWEHESDELINDPRAGMDHYALTVKQGEVIGLKPRTSKRRKFPPWCALVFMPGIMWLCAITG